MIASRSLDASYIVSPAGSFRTGRAFHVVVGWAGLRVSLVDQAAVRYLQLPRMAKKVTHV